MQIISMEKSPEKNDSSWKITLEDESEFLISVEDYYSQGLYCLEEVEKEFLELLSHKLQVKKAKSLSLRWVLGRNYTVSEIDKKLKDKEFNGKVIKDTLDYLQEQCYLDDNLYAEKFTAQRMRIKPVAKQRLLFELQGKGINKETIINAIEKIDVDDDQIAQNIFDKRFSDWDLEDPKKYKKAVNFLINKGFSMNTIRKVIKSSNFDQND